MLLSLYQLITSGGCRLKSVQRNAKIMVEATHRNSRVDGAVQKIRISEREIGLRFRSNFDSHGNTGLRNCRSI